ncbi:MAG: type IX secretion system membrane protein PorP/SprF [Bacteroidota bacterium]
MQKYNHLVVFLFLTFGLFSLQAQQEEAPFIAYDVPTQNLLKFNRFLLNPTFSTVREDKSYINLFHRNQSVSFDDNNQTYFLSYSGRIGDRSGLGLSLYTQREGLIDNFGLLANYAYGIKLSDKSNFTFGANFSYYNSGFNQNRANPIDDDPLLNSLDNSALITFQPGFNISYGAFDLGAFAENLFDYNLKTSESITDFSEKTYTGHLQYTHQFKNNSGIFESGRLMPLARVSSVAGEDVVLGGSLILDLPKLGWLQAGYDDFYGAAAGIGFNLNKRISLGYTVEQGLSNNFDDFGVTHEISLAYSFTPNLTEDRVMLEKDNEDLVSNDDDDDTPVEELSLSEKDLKIAELEQKLAENDAILDELLLRQDSIERNRQNDLERRFTTVMKMVRRATQDQNPEIEQKARDIYFANMDSVDMLASVNAKKPISNSGLSSANTNAKTIQLPSKKQKLNPTASKDPAVVTAPPKAKDAVRYKKSSTKLKSFSIANIESGHYLIANVYRGTKYMTKFIEELHEQGIEADYFTNPRNGLNYVYLKNFNDRDNAIAAYKSGLNGTYSGDTWVMKVNGTQDYSDLASRTDNSSNYDDSVLQHNVNTPQQKVPVSYKTIDANGIASGFYIIANVFENPANANRFVRFLNAKGLSASYFINPENKYRYVYLKKHDDWTNALTSYYSKLNDAYHDPMWIMRVKPNQTS